VAVCGLPSVQVLVPRQFARVCHSVSMELGVMESHVAVSVLHNCGKYHSEIFEQLLKPLKIWGMFVCRAIKHYKELWR